MLYQDCYFTPGLAADPKLATARMASKENVPKRTNAQTLSPKTHILALSLSLLSLSLSLSLSLPLSLFLARSLSFSELALPKPQRERLEADVSQGPVHDDATGICTICRPGTQTLQYPLIKV